jgi:hypothetical protein
MGGRKMAFAAAFHDRKRTPIEITGASCCTRRLQKQVQARASKSNLLFCANKHEKYHIKYDL